MCYPLFLLYKLLNMFRATMCPSSGDDDCIVLSPHVGIVLWLQESCQNWLAGSVSIRIPQWTHYLLTGSDSLPAATAQHQHVAITLCSHQLLKMVIRLPETCRATCKGEIKITQKWHLVGFLPTLNCCSTSWPTVSYSNFCYDESIKHRRGSWWPQPADEGDIGMQYPSD